MGGGMFFVESSYFCELGVTAKFQNPSGSIVRPYGEPVLGVNLQQNIGLEKSQNIGDIG